ncbi:unnamed protein product [Staurois parvus]|uniref:Threonyl/alanyl tRNA synthetase SAD domain-containing protein n=1 Tax=Staurois parvus TaxID=386267 RepID=A0ABN9EK40_9NEOB|nr:unnamed protein product [Staurois parvus]
MQNPLPDGQSQINILRSICSIMHRLPLFNTLSCVSIRGVSSNDFTGLENLCKKIMKEKQQFERLEISKETLLEMFKYNKFKCRILNEKVDTPTTTVYRCGPLIDLCRGPHVRHTGKIKAFKIHKNSSTYWEGKADMETLQRIYGISFPDTKMLKKNGRSSKRRPRTEITGRLEGSRSCFSFMN